MIGTRRRIFGSLAVCVMMLISTPGRAEEFPEHPVHLLVGFSPGGGTDTLARLLGQKLSGIWGQPVIVENREGADGTIAENIAAHAAPDGYTIIMITNTHVTTPSQYKLNYDPINSFASVSLLASQPDALLVNPSLPVQSVAELITLAKAKPGTLNFGSSGTGTAEYLAMALFMKTTGTNLVNVSYKGVAPAQMALVGGETQVMFGSVTANLPLVRSGKLRALAVSATSRFPAMPEVPTVAEAAHLADFDVGVWYGVLAPAGVPDAIVAKLHRDVVGVVKSAEFQQRLSSLGFVSIASTPEEFTQAIKNDLSRWSALLGASQAK